MIANIPYYLTSKLIRKLLDEGSGPSQITLLVQKEVALRACQRPPKMNLLALSIQVFGGAQIIHQIPAGAFYPVPKIDSALLDISVDVERNIEKQTRIELFRLAKTAFQQKRKTLANSLASLEEWNKEKISALLSGVNIDPGRRPQTLSLEEWLEITRFRQKL